MEPQRVENLNKNVLIVKNLPKKIDNVSALLQTPAENIKSFGRRRVLLYYANKAEAEAALKNLEDRDFMVAKFTTFEEEGTNVWKNKANKTTQTKKKPKEKKESIASLMEDVKQLGLIETIYVDGAEPDNNNSSTKSKKSHYNQAYTYVVAIDFEATCWEKQAPPHWRESEIIEFPAVLMNLKTGKIEAEFHKYIMPMESPKLSAFCTELTGITQKTVDSGIPLQTALMMFHEWLRKELRSRNLTLPKMSKDNKIGNCAFVTWTDWDFGICLAKECQRKRLKKPQFFNQWIDIRAIYREWYKHRPLNFNDALTNVGLTFEGRAHSGIDDAKNLATLTYKLIRDGATLSLTKDLTPFQLNTNCIL